MEELEKMSLVELRLYGRKLGMKNATTFKKKELIGEIQKILASGEAPEAEKTAKSSAKGSREKKSDTTEGKRTAKTTAKPAGRRTERRPARKNDYEDRAATSPYSSTLCHRLVTVVPSKCHSCAKPVAQL